jgi:hypothetical protein
MNSDDMLRKIYKPLSLGTAILFTVVGLIFLLCPQQVLIFFNACSDFWGLSPTPVAGFDFYVILAVGYMYLVTVLAYMMYRYPKKWLFPFLLAHGKIMSSLLSLAAFLFQQRYLIYISNFLVDGFIGIVAFYLYYKVRKLTND